MIRSRLLASVLWVFASGALFAQGGADPTAPVPLFARVEPAAPADYPAVAVRMSRVELHPGVLRSARRLAVPLPDGRTVVLERDVVRSERPGHLFWAGWNQEHMRHRAWFTVTQGGAWGSIPTDTAFYRLLTLADGGTYLAEVDLPDEPYCGVTGSTASDVLRAPAPEEASRSLPARAHPADGALPAGTVEIKVLAYYTPQAAAETGDIAGHIQSGIDYANDVFSNSQMAARFILVGTELANHSDSGVLNDDLKRLKVDPGVRKRRNQLGADLVALTVGQGIQKFRECETCELKERLSCGYAWRVMGEGDDNRLFEEAAFAAQAMSLREPQDGRCAPMDGLLAHELGHLLGFNHDPNSPGGTSPNPLKLPDEDPSVAFGHIVETTTIGTVMTYQTGSDRAPHFSNPNVCVPVGLDCLPTGIAGAAENYRTGNYTAPIVSEFREAPIGLSITGSCPGEITASISGGTPLEKAQLVLGFEDSLEIPDANRCAGVGLGVRPLQRQKILTVPLDAAGTWQDTRSIELCDDVAQALDLVTCSVSPVVPVGDPPASVGTKLLPTVGAEGALFGSAVDLSGDTAIVGHGGNVSQWPVEAAYIFEWTDGTWDQTATLSSGASGLTAFGGSVALDRDTAVVGAYYEPSPPGEKGYVNEDAGAVYVFVRGESGWSRQAKLIAPNDDVWALDYFGRYIALSGDTLAVGSQGFSSENVYIYVRSGASWSLQGTLELDSSCILSDVALSGDIVAVASDGCGGAKASIFARDSGTWSQETILEVAPGAWGPQVAVSGETVLVGSPFEDGMGTQSGATYVFARNGLSWEQQARLIAGDGGDYEYFGIALAIEGDTAVVGAQRANATYIYRRTGSTWSEAEKLSPDDGWSAFGTAAAISGSRTLIGGPKDDDNGTNSGAAYVYEMPALLSSGASEF